MKKDREKGKKKKMEKLKRKRKRKKETKRKKKVIKKQYHLRNIALHSILHSKFEKL